MRGLRVIWAVSLAALCGCRGRATYLDNLAPTPTGPECKGYCFGASALTRITAREYANSVLDVFGVVVPMETLPADGAIAGFFTNDQNPIADGDVDLYRQTAEQVADEIVSSQGVMDALVSPLGAACQTPDATCAAAFFDAYGSQLYRRPLTSDEQADYAALYAWSVTPATDPQFTTGGSGTFADGIRYGLEKMFASPGLLYRVELGAPTGDPNVVGLTSQEVAARLAAFALRSVPDAELSAEAAAGRLATADQVAAQLERLLMTSKGARMWQAFARDWMSTQQIATSSAPTVGDAPAHWSPAVTQGLQDDVEQTFAHLVQSDGRVQTLLTSAGGVVQGDALQWIVGVTGAPGTWVADMPHRHGMLTWPGWVVANDNPGFTHAHFRGLWVRRNLLCQSIGSPPADLAQAIASAQSAEENAPSAPTDRERMHGLSEVNAVCGSCHHYTNPIGYGLDAYDFAGRYRTTQVGTDGNTYPIDASGVLQGRADGSLVTDVDGTFADGTELIDRLAGSAMVAQCLETELARFALQRVVAFDDNPWLDDVFAGFDSSGRDLRHLAAQLARSDAFRFRRLPPP